MCSLPEGQSPEGVFHLLGNVYEWTSDGYRAYGDDSAGRDPQVPPEEAKKGKRVIRGGGLHTNLINSLPWSRDDAKPEGGKNILRQLGVRAARDIPSE